MIPDCKWTRPRIIACLDGELDEPDEELVNEHLSTCPACRVVAEAERALTARVREVAGAERAPAHLAERVRRGLAQARAEAGAAAPETPAAGRGEASGLPPQPAATPDVAGKSSRRRPLPRRAMGWSLALTSAAALLLIVGAGVFWPGSGRSLVSAMASEHHEHSGSHSGGALELVSGDTAELETYLTDRLGTSVKLPRTAFPKAQGADCCRLGQRDSVLVACFCQRRSHAVTLFVVKSAGLSMRGLERVRSDDRDFWRGSAGECRAVLWKSGAVCYALVGEFKDQADHMDLAERTALAVDVRQDR